MNKALALALVLAGAATASLAQDVKPNADEGRKKMAMCIGCHGIYHYQTAFPEVYKVPKISGQTAKYIASSLVAYRSGERRHPSMRGIAQSLSDQDIADLAAVYSANAPEGTDAVPEQPPAPLPEVAALLTKGACASCHGANFTKPIDPAYPKLAGQHADYLYAALKSYQIENKPVVGRVHAIMGPQTKPFSHVELKAISNYIGSLPGEMATVPEPRFR